MRFAQSLTYQHDDRLNVYDGLPRVVITTTTTGSFVRERAIDLAGRQPAGSLWQRHDTTVATTSRVAATGVIQDLELSVSGHTTRLLSLERPVLKPIADLGCVKMGGQSPVFTPSLLSTWGRAGIAASAGSEYSISVFEGGNLRARMRRPIQPPKAREEHALRLPDERYAVYIDGIAQPPCTVSGRRLAAEVGFADHVPLISNLMWDGQGRLWVERFETDDKARRRYDVFDSTGYLGTISTIGKVMGFPAQSSLLMARQDTSSGGEHLVLHRIEP